MIIIRENNRAQLKPLLHFLFFFFFSFKKEIKIVVCFIVLLGGLFECVRVGRDFSVKRQRKKTIDGCRKKKKETLRNVLFSFLSLLYTHSTQNALISPECLLFKKRKKKKNIVCAFLFWGSLFHFFSKQVFLFCFSFLAASKSLIREMFILKMLNMRSLLSFLFLFKFKINRNEITIGFCSTGNRTWSTSCGFTVVVVVNKRRASFPFFFFFKFACRPF